MFSQKWVLKRDCTFLVEEILKLDLAFLEAGGVDVGNVVGDGIEAQLLSFHPGGACVE